MTKINIFGVGRSGTKAIQLWLAYLLIQKFGKIKLVYEPFLYKNRFLEANFTGKLIHKYTPLFLDDKNCHEAPEYFSMFCKSISGKEPTIAKFIRGNGRINTINEITNPDFSVLIIRDLYNVLESISLQTWNLVENRYEWERLANFTEKRYPELRDSNFDWRKAANSMVKNAIYWFTMNMYALEHLDDRTIVLNFNQFVQDEYHLQLYKALESLEINVPQDAKISASLFRGNMHKNNIFVDSSPTIGSQKEQQINLFQRLLLKSLPLLSRYPKPDRITKLQAMILASQSFSQSDIGEYCTMPGKVSFFHPEKDPIKYPKFKFKAQKHPFLDHLSEKVNSKMIELSGLSLRVSKAGDCENNKE